MYKYTYIYIYMYLYMRETPGEPLVWRCLSDAGSLRKR